MRDSALKLAGQLQHLLCRQVGEELMRDSALKLLMRPLAQVFSLGVGEELMRDSALKREAYCPVLGGAQHESEKSSCATAL